MCQIQQISERPERIVIANIGQADQGKSTTIMRVVEILFARYPNPVFGPSGRRESRAILQINGVRVGIDSMGDPGFARPAESFEMFRQNDCRVILCACRSRGETRDLVENLRNFGYSITWAPNIRPMRDSARWRNMWNETYAQNMARFIEDYAFGRI